MIVSDLLNILAENEPDEIHATQKISLTNNILRKILRNSVDNKKKFQA